MSIEETLDRLATNVAMIAGAISTLAEAVNGTYKGNPIYAQQQATPPADDPKPKKAGRPAKGEADGQAVKPDASTAAATVAATATAKEPSASPTSETPKQVGTKEAMKAAVLAYRDATDQATALKLLTDVGAENFGTVKPEDWQKVTDAAVAVLAAVSKPVVKEVDPFGDDSDEPAAAPTVVLADVKKAFVARQKEVAESALTGVLLALGASAPGPGGAIVPSLKHLDPSKFAEAIAKVNALPKTK